MQEMDRRIALLRLLMVEIGDRERQAQQVTEQLRKQLPRIVDFAVRHNTSVSSALSSLADVEGRLREQEDTLRHLKMLRERAQGELDALLVTRGVTDAHARLAELESRRAQLIASAQVFPPSDTPPGGESAPSVPPETASAPSVAPPSALPPAELDEIDREITELRAAIQSASDAAARALTSHAPLHLPDIRTEPGQGLSPSSGGQNGERR